VAEEDVEEDVEEVTIAKVDDREVVTISGASTAGRSLLFDLPRFDNVRRRDCIVTRVILNAQNTEVFTRRTKCRSHVRGETIAL
jgi:hypothetical protein